MLSRPPASLAASISASAAPIQRPRLAQDLGDPLLGDHRREAVAAQQEDVPGAHRVGPGVDLDVRLGSQRAGDDRALRVSRGLLLGSASAGARAPRRASGPGSGARACRRGTDTRGCRRRGRSPPMRRRRRRPSAWCPSRPVRGRRGTARRSGGWLRGPVLRGAARGCRIPGGPSAKVSIAILDATSPAWAPPIPSATTNTGRARERVVLVVAALAAGVGPQCCLCRAKHLSAASDRSLLVGELAVADPNTVPRP